MTSHYGLLNLLCKLINSTSDKILELNADGQGGVGTYLINYNLCFLIGYKKREFSYM